LPLNNPVSYERTKRFAHSNASSLERVQPRKVLSKMAKALRAGKVFVDWSQNDRHKSTVCVYSLRAQEQPTVSTPVSWDEVEEGRGRRDRGGLVLAPSDVLQRLEEQGDLFAPVETLKQRLPDL